MGMIKNTWALKQYSLSARQNMKINQAGLDLIKSFESLRLKAYQDSVGVWTIGWGHTATAQPGQVITKKRAKQLLQDDVASFERAVAANVVGFPTTSNEFSAMVSLAFNIGAGAFKRSTLLKRHKAGQTDASAKEFGMWVYAGGKKLAGLVRRRRAEAALYLSPDSEMDEDPIKPDVWYEVQMPVLRLLSTGLPVVCLQEMLEILPQDGLFGVKTDQAVRDYQSACGMTSDGIVGPSTWDEIKGGET